jgi:ribonuclease T1
MLRKNGAGWRLAAAVVLAALSTGFSPAGVQAKGPVPGTEISTIPVAALPEQGRQMVSLIYQGGPFRYDKDGAVFGNRERMLPAKNRGYYREYTVKTPGERSRGARRIVCGGLIPTTPDACYYTDDHYASFRRIAQ